MPQPFFIEHTVYGAAIAFVIPMIFYLVFFPGQSPLKIKRKWGLSLLLFILIVAEFLAFSRAAWFSLLALPVILVIMKLKLKQGLLFIGLLILFYVFVMNADPLENLIRRNEAQSNRGNIREQIESVSNIQTDISNLERINRWKCALRMFKARPVYGYGPGTYQFVYGGFQVKKEMTRISTYHGEKGNAHSEYLGFLAETGFPGLLIYLCLIFATVSTAIRIIYRTNDILLKNLTIVVLLSVLTFYFHTIFNGFIETDKIGSLYYGSLAGITALDIYFFRRNT
jgi:putative inorganic carbon (hco3(-)) transporter